MGLLIVAGAGILLILGLVHALYTLQSSPDGGPMAPTDADVRAAMGVTGGLGLAPEIETTLWRAWAGFNLSHSLGVIVVALTVGVPALVDIEAAVANPGWLALAVVLPPLYLVLSIRYWFQGPTIGITVAMALIVAGLLGSTLG